MYLSHAHVVYVFTSNGNIKDSETHLIRYQISHLNNGQCRNQHVIFLAEMIAKTPGTIKIVWRQLSNFAAP